MGIGILEEVFDNRPNLWYNGEGNWFEFSLSRVYKKGDKGSDYGKILQEINIRLAGFGGNVPSEDFTERTEKTVKQFQKDYMKIEEPSGEVDVKTIEAIDEFCEKWVEQIVTYKCLCIPSSKVLQTNKCSGYGKSKKNEHPGIHRTLLWSVSTLKYYLSDQKMYNYNNTSAGYRCWAHNNSIPRTSTNHMGKAVDIQFNKNGTKISGKNQSNLQSLKTIRDSFYIKYLKAEEGWSIPSGNNNLRLEPIGIGKDQSYSWIHMDISKFEKKYLEDVFFVKKQNLIKSTPLNEI